MGLSKEEKVCPLCGKDNGCQHGQEDCWCTSVVVPSYVLDMVPDDKKGKVCVCRDCIEKYK